MHIFIFLLLIVSALDNRKYFKQYNVWWLLCSITPKIGRVSLRSSLKIYGIPGKRKSRSNASDDPRLKCKTLNEKYHFTFSSYLTLFLAGSTSYVCTIPLKACICPQNVTTGSLTLPNARTGLLANMKMIRYNRTTCDYILGPSRIRLAYAYPQPWCNIGLATVLIGDDQNVCLTGLA